MAAPSSPLVAAKIRSWFPHGHTGLLFESGDAAGLAQRLRDLLGNPELRRRLAANATRLRHEKFSIQQSALRMTEIYTAALRRKRVL